MSQGVASKRRSRDVKLIGSRLLRSQMDLMPFVNKAGCECLNESDDCGFDNCLIKDSSYMESDCDEQVLADIANVTMRTNVCVGNVTLLT